MKIKMKENKNKRSKQGGIEIKRILFLNKKLFSGANAYVRHDFWEFTF